MPTFDFSKELEKSLEKELNKPSTGEIERWLSSFQNLQTEMAAKLLFLARFAESIPDDMKKKYVETLLSVLESVPDDVRISTSDTLKEKLVDFSKSLDEDSEKKLRSALERSTQVA